MVQETKTFFSMGGPTRHADPGEELMLKAQDLAQKQRLAQMKQQFDTERLKQQQDKLLQDAKQFGQEQDLEREKFEAGKQAQKFAQDQTLYDRDRQRSLDEWKRMKADREFGMEESKFGLGVEGLAQRKELEIMREEGLGDRSFDKTSSLERMGKLERESREGQTAARVTGQKDVEGIRQKGATERSGAEQKIAERRLRLDQRRVEQKAVSDEYNRRNRVLIAKIGEAGVQGRGKDKVAMEVEKLEADAQQTSDLRMSALVTEANDVVDDQTADLFDMEDRSSMRKYFSDLYGKAQTYQEAQRLDQEVRARIEAEGDETKGVFSDEGDGEKWGQLLDSARTAWALRLEELKRKTEKRANR